MATSTFKPDPRGELNPDDYSHFQRSRQRVDSTYNLGLAQNTHQQDVLRRQEGRGWGDLTRQFSQMRAKLPYSYGNRGMLNSGAYQRGITDFANDRARATTNYRNEFADQMSGLSLARNQLEQVRTESNDDLATQEAARRASVAAALTAARR